MTNPFANFTAPQAERNGLRRAITAATFRPEPDCLPPLLEQAEVAPAAAEAISAKAKSIVETLRSRTPAAGMSALMHEYSLSTAEGIALMALAEALLRTPDRETRDALIRDKISKGDWGAHLGTDRSLFVNASSLGLLLTGKLTAESDERGLARALSGLVARGGEPFIRTGVDTAMRLLGDQFVAGETIQKALDRARRSAEKGFRYSYDMLGEAAMTAEDAARYFADYEQAIAAIGQSARGDSVYDRPGISIKLSALHPRYERSQRDRVLGELLPDVLKLCVAAKSHNIGLNIDAEEAARLELSLDLLEDLAFAPELQGWEGLGFVVQAYGKRCPFVIDYLVDLAKRSKRRLMVRLVKGAYWDSEIKHSQVNGHRDYPVFTRKVHTDVSYQACVRKLLAAPDTIYPQFATHNAQTVAYVLETAGKWQPGAYEFQCLYGMGEPLYEPLMKSEGVPCRVYAPVGPHTSLLAYLVRRLLENGANSSFVNQVADPKADLSALSADPLEEARKISPLGTPHTGITLPKDILAPRISPTVPVLTDEADLEALQTEFSKSANMTWRAAPPDGIETQDEFAVRNPADPDDPVGHALFAAPEAVDTVVSKAQAAHPGWAGLSADERARKLEGAADLLQARMSLFSGLIMREAGKTAANALGDVREAIDFLRYYASEIRRRPDAEPLGVIACISPWNFPLAIFLGQVSAALAGGNCVIAKPAEETPLIAAAGVSLLHEAGIPEDVVQLLPGAGDVGGALTAHRGVCGVVFTGSTEVGRLINQTLARRVGPDGRPVPLIAETGGLNAMLVDSSALAEQVVADVLTSAFDSAGQRCSALRLLCLQEDVADRLLAMIKGAMAELRLGNPVQLKTDIGPVIGEEARARIAAYIERRRGNGFAVTAPSPLPAQGTFIPPTLIELNSVDDMEEEIFGPVLHVVRYARKDRLALVDAINALGYGLTFGVHSRLDSEVARLTARAHCGNVYVNRNIIGAVVGVQPFGGHGLSGTGPKAGGPIYLDRLMREAHTRAEPGSMHALPGPVGESNVYALEPKGRVLIIPETEDGLICQVAAVAATGNLALIDAASPFANHAAIASPRVPIKREEHALETSAFSACLVEGQGEALLERLGALAARPGPLVTVQAASSAEVANGGAPYNLALLVNEKVVSTNTAAAGGNASLMTLDPKGM